MNIRCFFTIKWFKVQTIPGANVQQRDADSSVASLKKTAGIYGPYYNAPVSTSFQEMQGTDGYRQVFGSRGFKMFHRNIYKDEGNLFPDHQVYFLNTSSQQDYPNFKAFLRCEHTNATTANKDLMDVLVTFKMRVKWLGHSV